MQTFLTLKHVIRVVIIMLQKFETSPQKSECHSREISTSTSYSGGLGFTSQPGDDYSELGFSWFSLSTQG
jgi:hypothetical protein